MTTVAVEAGSGVVVLPARHGEPEWLTSWEAYQAVDADLRARNPYWHEVAGRIEVRRVNE